jgi:penicillin amidase
MQPFIASLVVLAIACGDNIEVFPTDPVEIVIDDMGIPHVYAQNDADAFYGAGYQMAVDRLYQIEMIRRRAFGRVAEVLGDARLSEDMLARTFDLVRYGRADAEATRAADPERARLLRAWVAGINARIAEVRAGKVPLPLGFRTTEHDFLPERWDDDDPYIIVKGANLVLDKTIEFELAVTMLQAVYPDVIGSVQLPRPAHAVFGLPPEDRPPSDTRITPPARLEPGARPADRAAAFAALAHGLALLQGGGSNNWAIDGRFTANARPMLAGDPHLSFSTFGAPYPMHLDSRDAGGSYDVAGFAYPGTPGIALGHTREVAWTATSAFADVTDVWQVERAGGGVKVGHDVAHVVHRTETITVRDPGAPAGVGHDVTLVVEDVPGYGIILPPDLLPLPIGGPYLVNWTGFAPRPQRWFMELDRIATLDDFEAAVGRMREMMFNFVAADASGIAYRVGVEVPVRDVAPGREPWRAMDGGDPASLWTSARLSPDQLPHSRATERGWIATANNDPFGFTANGRVDDDPWYYGAFFDPGYRASRLEAELARLTARGAVDVGDMQALQLDATSTLAADLLPLLAEARDHVATDPALSDFANQPELDAVVHLLATEWDRRMVRDSHGALAFNAFLHYFASEALQPEIPAAYSFATDLEMIVVLKVAQQVVRGDFPDATKFLVGGRDAVMLRAAKRTAAWLDQRFGSVGATPAYGTMKVTKFDGAFGFDVPVFAVPSDGGEDTVQVAQQISFADDAPRWTTSYVSVERSVFAFGDDGVVDLYASYPVGNAADPDSPETRVANDDYVNGRYRKLYFRRADVDAHVASRTVIPAAR